MDLDAWVCCKPVADLDSLVRGVVVHHQVQFLFRVGTGHMLEETEELLVAVPVLAEPGHLPGGDFQGGEQGGGAMADVVVAALLVVARLHHKHFLGAVQRLDLGLLIDAQHDRVGRRVQIQAYNVGDLGLQFRVGGELERVGLPWPDPCTSSRPW